MLFSVIYEFDIPMHRSVAEYLPKQRKLFDTMERSDGEPSDWNGDIWNGKVKHRKLCAILTRKQFEQFLGDAGLSAEDVRTMGSIGAPGCGYGIAPAIAFNGNDPDAIQSAYVTPLPLAYTLKDLEVGPRKTFTEEDFDQVRKVIIEMY